MSKPTELTIAGPEFWTKADQNGGLHTDSGLYYVVLKDSTPMELVRRTTDEKFTATAKRAAARGLRVIINGPYFSFTTGGYAFMSPKPAAEVQVTGRLVSAHQSVGGTLQPEMFFVANVTGPKGPYLFGQGDTPVAGSSAGIGGLGPLIINGLKYGIGNKYRPKPTAAQSNGPIQKTGAGALKTNLKIPAPPATGPTTGEPPPEWKDYVIQRNNNTYTSAEKRGKTTGKAVIAYSRSVKRLLIAVLPDTTFGAGMTYDTIRDKLAGVGVNDAVFLDGSNSVLLMVDGVILVAPNFAKDNSNVIGVGFGVTAASALGEKVGATAAPAKKKKSP